MTLPYRPAATHEGACFMTAYCCRCRHDAAFQAGAGDSCIIAANAVAFNVDDPRFPKEWVVIDGQPTCTAFAELGP